jgi:hypothetical protein
MLEFEKQVANLGELGGLMRWLGGAEAQAGLLDAKGEHRNDMNINISRVDVAANDPDRFVHELVTQVKKTARSPTQSDRQLRGGF